MASDLPSLELLRTFRAIHRAGTISAATRSLGLSQPTVTARLQQLEDIVGVRLFDRSARGCVPTPAAADLAAEVEEPLNRPERVAARLVGEVDLLQSTLRVGAPAELTEEVLAPVLARLAARGVQIEIELGLAADLLDGLLLGRLEMVVSTVRPPSRLRSQPLMDEELALVASPEVAAAVDRDFVGKDAPAALAELTRVVDDRHPSILRRWWRHVLGVAPGPGDRQIVVPDLRAVRALVEEGAGIAVLPTYLCERAIEEGRLVVVLEPDDAPINTIYLVTTPAAAAQPTVGVAWDALLGELAHLR